MFGFFCELQLIHGFHGTISEKPTRFLDSRVEFKFTTKIIPEKSF